MAALLDNTDFTAMGFTAPTGMTTQQVDMVIEAIELVAAKMMKRVLAPVTITEYPEHNPNGNTDELWLEWEVSPTGLASVQVWQDYEGSFGQAEDAFDETTELVAGEDFAVDPRMKSCIRRLGQWWGHMRPGSLKVVYPTGEWANKAALPIDLKMAILTLANAQMRIMRSKSAALGPLASESVGNYSYAVLTGAENSQAYGDLSHPRRVINTYRRPIA